MARRRVSAGVTTASWSPRAASSSWITCWVASMIPTSFMSTARCGLVPGYPLNVGDAVWASVKKPNGTVDPMCRPYSCAPPADMTNSSMRRGSAMRPRTSLTRSTPRYSPFRPPSKAGGASPGTPFMGRARRGCIVPSNPTTTADRCTYRTLAMALSTRAEYPTPVLGANSVKNCTCDGLVLAR